MPSQNDALAHNEESAAIEESAVNKELIRWWIEVGLRQGNTSVVEETISESATYEDCFTSSLANGREGAKQRIEHLHTCFPDLDVTIEGNFGLIAEGNKVVAQLKMSGTYACTLCKIFPMSTLLNITPIAVYQIDEHKISRWWIKGDALCTLSHISEGISSVAQPSSAHATKSNSLKDVVTELEKLGKLKAEEILTQEEFTAYKRTLFEQYNRS